MATLQAVCPGCSLPLRGELVANSCNAVFHRACHATSTTPCPTCGKNHDSSSNLDLFGITFGDDCDSEAASMVVEVDGKLVSSGSDDRNEVVEICALQDQVSETRQLLAEALQSAASARSACERQLEKLQAAQRTTAKREAEQTRLASELEDCSRRHASLVNQAAHMRQTDAVLEYWEELRNKSPQEALDFLIRTVNMMDDPAKTFTEVLRLREYHRTKLADWQRQSLAAARRESKARRETDELNAAIREVRERLARFKPAPQTRGRGDEPGARGAKRLKV